MAMAKRETLIIPLEVASELRWSSEGDVIEFDDCPNTYIVVTDPDMYDQRRWATWFSVVFRLGEDPRFWEWNYGLGSTEYQEHPSIDDDSERTAYEVFKREKTVVVYE